MKLCLNVFGSPYTYGWLPPGSSKRAPEDLLLEAVTLGLAGVELPGDMIEPTDPRQLERLAGIRADRGLYLVLSTEGTDPDHLARMVDAGAALGASVVRTVVGGAAFGGDRRPLAGRWASFLRTIRARLAKAVARAERAGLSVAVENHQDLNSEDLVWLCETIDSPSFGVVLDTANPLSVAELPLDFAARVAPYVKHVHLKDYHIYLSASGYRLVRCASGEGVVPFAAVLDLLRQHGRGDWGSVEVGAIEARHVRVFEPDFWPDYPTRSAAHFASVMAFVLRHARPAVDDYRTPHEAGRPVTELVQYERRQAGDSLRNMLALTGASAGGVTVGGPGDPVR